jgi:alpha-L-fucosidase 2
MLVQSWGGEIHLLPALPAAWPDGAIRGVRARGAVTLDLRWRGGELRRVVLRGAPGQALRLRYRGVVHAATLDARGRYAWSGRPT